MGKLRAILILGLLAGGMCPYSVRAQQQPTPASLLGGKIQHLRGNNNKTYTIVVTGTIFGGSGVLWGTGIYTDDSMVAMAAVHAGVVGLGLTKTVPITILPAQSNYQGSTRNGVTSSSWNSYPGSFSFGNVGQQGGGQQNQNQQQAQNQQQNPPQQQATPPPRQQNQSVFPGPQQQSGGIGSRVQGRGSAVILRRRYNPRRGRVEIVKYGVISQTGFLNLRNTSLQNRRQSLRNYRFR